MKYALLFPGQGSQAVGMLAALAQQHAVVGDTLAEADAVLGWKLGDLIRNGPEAELNQTEKTQPALLAAGVAVWRAWQSQVPGHPPTAMAGHSLGEYAALVAAGSLQFADALRLVERRGQLMQSAVPDGSGGMVAIIGLDDSAVEALCGQYRDGVLEAVNYNAPGQVVVAGTRDAIAWLETAAPPAGARMVVRLPVSVPSHCRLMSGAAQALMEELENVQVTPPSVPVLHNLDAAARDEAKPIREALRDQLHRPVRWTDTVAAMVQQDVALFLECGPGRVLSGLNKRMGRLPSVALESPEGMEQARQQVTEGGGA